jgi:hypothetical protein
MFAFNRAYDITTVRIHLFIIFIVFKNKWLYSDSVYQGMSEFNL